MARILVIAPITAGLPDVAAATQAIASAHQCQVLQAADTTQREIVEAASAGSYDVVWFFGHLTGGGGFALPTGELSIESIVSVVNMSSADLAILTVCKSWPIGQRLLSRTKASVIYTQTDGFSADVMLVTVALAQALARTHNYRDAFTLAQPGELYVYQENSMPTQDQPVSGNLITIDRLYNKTEQIQQKVIEIELAIARLQVAVTTLQNDLHTAQEELKELKKQTVPTISTATWVSIALGLITVILIGLLLFRAGIQ